MKYDSMSNLIRGHNVPPKHLGIPLQPHLIESLSPNHRRDNRFAIPLPARLVHTLHNHIKRRSPRKLKEKRSEVVHLSNELTIIEKMVSILYPMLTKNTTSNSDNAPLKKSNLSEEPILKNLPHA